VEDKEKHLADAKAYFAQKSSVVAVTYATTLHEAQKSLEAKTDAVISDVFFPLGAVPDPEQKIKELESMLRPYAQRLNNWELRQEVEFAMNKWATWATQESPAGVYVDVNAQTKGIPIVFNTDQHHHSFALEPVNQWNNAKYNDKRMKYNDKRIKYTHMVESGTHKGPPAESKNWKLAFAAIVCLHEGLDAQAMEGLYQLESHIAEFKRDLETAKKEGREKVETYRGPLTVDVAEKVLEQVGLELKEKRTELQPIVDKYLI